MRNSLLVPVAVMLLGACGGEAPPPVQSPAPAPVALVAPAAPAPAVPAQLCGVPSARTVDVTETKFGIAAPDPYRWMEGNDNAETTAWLRAQGDCARAYINRIAGRDALFKRLHELGLGTSNQYEMQIAGGRAFFAQVGAGEQLAKLVVREPGGTQRDLVDPSKMGREGRHASLNAFRASPDGRWVAYDIALGGARSRRCT